MLLDDMWVRPVLIRQMIPQKCLELKVWTQIRDLWATLGGKGLSTGGLPMRRIIPLLRTKNSFSHAFQASVCPLPSLSNKVECDDMWEWWLLMLRCKSLSICLFLCMFPYLLSFHWRESFQATEANNEIDAMLEQRLRDRSGGWFWCPASSGRQCRSTPPSVLVNTLLPCM